MLLASTRCVSAAAPTLNFGPVHTKSVTFNPAQIQLKSLRLNGALPHDRLSILLHISPLSSQLAA